jgi:hypothetical protein
MEVWGRPRPQSWKAPWRALKEGSPRQKGIQYSEVTNVKNAVNGTLVQLEYVEPNIPIMSFLVLNNAHSIIIAD